MRYCLMLAVSWMGFASFAAAQTTLEDDLGQAQSVTNDTVNKARQAQQRINQVDDQTRSLLEDYRRVVQQQQLFEADAKLMQARVDAQQAKLEQYEQSVQAIDGLKRELTPLLQRMIAQLDSFIRLDLPFQTVERLTVVEDLRTSMINPTLSDTERFRLIVEAWQNEIDYGFEVKSWRAILNDERSERRMVTYFRIGRIGLYYLGLDANDAGYWDRESKQWNRLNAEKNASIIQQIQLGVRIARNQAAPELLELPLPAPEKKNLIAVEAASTESQTPKNVQEDSP